MYFYFVLRAREAVLPLGSVGMIKVITIYQSNTKPCEATVLVRLIKYIINCIYYVLRAREALLPLGSAGMIMVIVI